MKIKRLKGSYRVLILLSRRAHTTSFGVTKIQLIPQAWYLEAMENPC